MKQQCQFKTLFIYGSRIEFSLLGLYAFGRIGVKQDSYAIEHSSFHQSQFLISMPIPDG
jgi:hypothetical protein